MQHLYFVRHGLSEMNATGHIAGRHTETPLTAEGRAQARAAGERAKQLGIDYIVSSPQGRAHDTARIIAEAIGYPERKIDVNSLFMERGMGVMEGQPWRPDINMDGIVDAERTDSLLQRLHYGYEFLLTLPADHILVVSHGATGRALRHMIHPDIPFNSNPFPNGKIVQLF